MTPEEQVEVLQETISRKDEEIATLKELLRLWKINSCTVPACLERRQPESLLI